MNLRSFFDRTPGFSSLPGIRDRTTLLLLLLALLAWTAGFSLWRDGGDLRNRRTLAEGRFTDLLAVLREYRSLAGLPSKGGEGTPAVLPADQDLLTAVSTVVSSLGLRSSMVSLSTASGRGGEDGVSITLGGSPRKISPPSFRRSSGAALRQAPPRSGLSGAPLRREIPPSAL
ncbi:hypothetical protein MASR2M17_08210 [Aminivibrio sp.]